MLSDGNALGTLLLACFALLALGCKSGFAAQHSSHDDIVIDGCNIRRIEHASLILDLKAFWNADIFRTGHAVSAACAGNFDAFFILGLDLCKKAVSSFESELG